MKRFRKRDRQTAKVSITQSGKDIVEKYIRLKIEKHVEIFKQYTLEEKEEFANYLRSFIGNTLHEDIDIDILCLQCNGYCGYDCVVEEKKRNLY